MPDRKRTVDASPQLMAAMEQHLLVVSPGKGGVPVDVASCWRVKKVAEVSPAAVLGLVPGDLLVSVDGRAVEPHPGILHLDPVDERRYRFRRRDGSLTDVLATGVDLGIAWAPTLERLQATWDPLEGDVRDLLEAWELQAWEALEDLAWRRCQGTRHGPGLLARFQRLKHPESPAAVLLGAALWEQGKRDQGVSLVAEWLKEHNDPAPIAALGWLYVARQEMEDGRRPRAVMALRESLTRYRLEAAVGRLVQWADETIPSEHGEFLGQPFPARYQLPPLDVDPDFADVVSFDAALADLRSGQILLVCVLGLERGNTAYNEAVFWYVNHQTWLPDLVAGMHVIVGKTERDTTVDHWVGEDLARGDGLPLLVLLDDYAKVHERVGSPPVPRIYAVDHRGTVVHEGDLDGVSLWNALAAAT